MWITHHETVAANRKRGAEKGAETRRQKATRSTQWICMYVEYAMVLTRRKQ